MWHPKDVIRSVKGWLYYAFGALWVVLLVLAVVSYLTVSLVREWTGAQKHD